MIINNVVKLKKKIPTEQWNNDNQKNQEDIIIHQPLNIYVKEM